MCGRGCQTANFPHFLTVWKARFIYHVNNTHDLILQIKHKYYTIYLILQSKELPGGFTLLHRTVALDWHRYGRIGKKNLRGRINGNTLCKLPLPKALGLYTPWLPLSLTSCFHACSRAKSVKKPDEPVHRSLVFWGEGVRCLWLQSCLLAWGQQLHHFRPPDLACGSSTFTPCFSSFCRLRGIQILNDRC